MKVIESNRARTRTIANNLGNGLVLFGDATDEELLQHEAIDETDLFLAVTNDEEVETSCRRWPRAWVANGWWR